MVTTRRRAASEATAGDSFATDPSEERPRKRGAKEALRPGSPHHRNTQKRRGSGTEVAQAKSRKKGKGRKSINPRDMSSKTQARIEKIVDDQYDVPVTKDGNASNDIWNDSEDEGEDDDEDWGDVASGTVFTAPSEDAIHSIAIRVGELQKALRCMKAWTERGAEWEEEVRIKPLENRADWLGRQKEAVKEHKSQRLLRSLYNLNKLCADTPNDMDEQGVFLRDRADSFSRAIIQVEHHVKVVVNTMARLLKADRSRDESQEARRMANGARQRIVPFMVLVLQTTFLAGTPVYEVDGEDALVDRKHGPCFVRLMSRVTDWIVYLVPVMEDEYSFSPLVSAKVASTDTKTYQHKLKQANQAATQRSSTLVAIEGFGNELDKKERQLQDEIEQPQLAIMAKENDRRIKARRAEEERRIARESKKYGDMWQSMQDQRRLQSSKARSSPAAPPGTAHPEYLRQWGWFFEEDERLLAVLEDDRVINLSALASSFPGRSPVDLQWRIAKLKERLRPKYLERLDDEPPEWLHGSYHDFRP